MYNNWKTNKNTLFLALFFIVLSVYIITHAFIAIDKSVFWTAVLYNHISPLTLLPGPLLFWYTRNTIRNKNSLKKVDYLHFLPAIIQLFAIMPYCLKPFSYKIEIAKKITENINFVNQISTNIFFNPYQNFTIRFVLFLIYILVSISYLTNFSFSKSRINDQKSFSNNNIKWLWILNIIPLIFVFVGLVLTYNCVINQPSVGLTKTKSLLLVLEISFFILTFSLLLFPNILYGIPTPTITTKKNKSPKKKKIINENEVKKSINKENPLYEIINKLKSYLEENKPFVNPNFSIDTISIDLQIPTNQITECLTIIYGKKFSEIKKELRVNYAKNLLENNTSEFITIDAIGQKAGFATRSNFYSAFKSITNSTPSEFINMLEAKKNNN
jgi:AraC-like DNA-binding protein